MSEGDRHLSLEEILTALLSTSVSQRDAASDRIQEHLAHCRECGDIAGEYRGVMAKFDEYGNGSSLPRTDCPPAETWSELAAGLLLQAESANALAHAAECRACSARLKEMLEILGSSEPPPADLARNLKSSGGRWQGNLAREMELRSGGSSQASVKPRHFGSFNIWAGAAAAVLIFALAGYFLLRQPSPQNLLAQAYAQQRPIELRIDGAPYGPIRVQRDQVRSQLTSPGPLLSAEVEIKKGLERDPEAPDFLRQKAEVDILNGDYQPAIETLGHALRLRPKSFAITLDLATAHFERAEATGSPGDYEACLNYLNEAIRLEPGSPTALFNRAITYERLYLFGSAIADWEQFLKLEKDADWKKEAEQRLQELRLRERQHSRRDSPERLNLATFKDDVTAKRLAGVEEYIGVMERQILPGVSPLADDNRNHGAAKVLADELKSAHRDLFLSDLLLYAHYPDFPRAARFLAVSSEANRQGRADEAYAAATQAAALFRKSRNAAGELAAGFEQTYALQFQSKANSCRVLAGKMLARANQKGYASLEIQLLLEQAICSNMNREIGPAKQFTSQALAMATEHDYQSFYLRGLTVLATLEAEAGNESSAWSAIHRGLALYWQSELPALRAYSLYVAMERMAEQLDHRNVQFAAVFEALQFPNPSSMVEASERMRLAEAALRLGELQVAEVQAQQAQQVFSAAPQTESVRWRELEARISLARVQAVRIKDPAPVTLSLLGSLPEVERLSNRYVEFQYYDTLAELKMQSGDSEAGEHFLAEAIRVTEDGLRSLPTWQEKLAWLDQNRSPYIRMTELLFRSGSPESALNIWEHFRAPDDTPLSESGLFKHANLSAENIALPPAAIQSAPETRIITYAFGHDGLMIWVRHLGEIHSVYSVVPPQHLRRAAENLIGECSRPDSGMSNLRADAQYLYKWLVEPVSQWLPPVGHMIVEPDGILGVVPLEVLMDKTGTYLGARYVITIASSVKATEAPTAVPRIQNSDRMLIAAGLTGTGGALAPPVGAMREARRVAERFIHPIVFAGNDVKVSHVGFELRRSEVFHFAGHAGLSSSGANMLMADGILGVDQAHAFGAHTLSKLKLAMFSACGTAKPSEMSDADSLVSEFLKAGAQNVVASRWNVDSMATADFVDLFYQAVLSGSSVAGAMQTAASVFRKTPERAHPYYWAAFSAFGRA